MVKKLIVFLVAILVVIAAVAMLDSAVGLSGLSFLRHRFSEAVGSSTPVQQAIPTKTVTSMTPTKFNPTSTPKTTQTTQSPVCFSQEELPPFAFAPDSSTLMVRSSQGVQLFDLKTGSLKAYIKSSQNLIVAALSPDGNILAWSLQDGTIQLVDLSSQNILATLKGHPDPVYHLKFSPTGDQLFSASHDGQVRIWDLNGNLLAAIQTGGEVLGFGISKNGSQLAIIPYDGPVSLWDLAGKTEIMKLGGTGGYDTSDAVFSPDGQYLAADLATGIYMWRLSDAKLVWNQVSNSMAVTFSPDGRYLAYSDIDDGNKVILADPNTAQPIRVIDTMQSPVWELFFSPDASLLAVTDGMEIHIWRVEDARLLAIGKSNCG